MKPKVGYLPLYIKLYDDDDPAMRDPMVAYKDQLVSKLEALGLEIVCADVCRLKNEFQAAAELFNRSGLDAVITQNLAYSPSLESIDAILSIEAPLIVFDTTVDFDLLGVADHYDGINPNHGIHGVQDLCSMLKRNGRSYQICAGHIENSGVLAEVVSMCRAAALCKAFRTAKVGSVGGSFEGMGDFLVTPEELRRATGAEIEYLDAATVKRLLGTVTEEEIEAEIAADKADFTWEVENEEYLREEVRSRLVLRKWIAERVLTAATVNFLNLDLVGLPTMPFIECSRMMARGIGYAGEGDVLTASFVGALMKVYGKDACFTEMFCPDWKHELLMLSHMGEINLAQAQWKPVVADLPFGYNAYGHTAAAFTCLKPGKAVLLNLAPMGERFQLIVTPVELVDAGRPDTVYRLAEQGWMKPVKPLRDFLREFSELGGTHHSALVYGADPEELCAFGRMMGFDVFEIR